MKKDFSVEMSQSVPMSFSVIRANGFDVFRNIEEIVMRMVFRSYLPEDVTLRESRVVAPDPMFMLTFWNGEFIRLTVLACTERLLMPFAPAVQYCNADDTAYLWFVKPEARIVRREKVVEQRHCAAVITFLYDVKHHLVGLEIVGARSAFSYKDFISKAESIPSPLLLNIC